MAHNKRPLRIGIIGIGGAGLAHVKYYRSIPNCQVVAFFDVTAQGLERAKRVAARALVTDDLQAFWKAGLDCVSICSPDSTHASYIKAALAEGIHVLCEKPLTDSLEGCKEILRSVKKYPGLVVGVQHQMRFVPLFQEVRQLVKKGVLGAISYLEGWYVHDLRERASLYDRWRFVEGATPLIYCGCHFIDLFRYFLEDEIESVVSMANHLSFPEYPESDLNVVLLRFRSGLIAKIIVSFGSSRPQDHSVRILGSHACVDNNILCDATGAIRLLAPPSILGEILPNASVRSRIRGALRNVVPWAYGRLWKYVFPRCGNMHYSFSYFPFRTYEHQWACRSSIVDFLQAVRHGSTPLVSVADAVETVVTAIAGVVSFRENRLVEVAEIRRQLAEG